MKSKSKLAHDELEKLEKRSAPFAEQLREAAKFIGVDFKDNGRVAERCEDAVKLSRLVPYKREEWLLIWLSKKLKADHLSRIMPSSWWLISYLIESLPLRSAARILSSKEIIREERENSFNKIRKSILQKTLEEAYSEIQLLNSATPKDLNIFGDNPNEQNALGQPATANMTMDSLSNLMDAIYYLLNFAVKSATLITGASFDDAGASLSAACMKTAYITTAEKAAELFGLWIALCEKVLSLSNLEITSSHSNNWLIPFVEVWNSRLRSDSAFLTFSTHCTPRILSLIQTLRQKKQKLIWQSELERLLSRNSLAPARNAFLRDPNSNALENYIKPMTPCDPNASVIFEISIRSIMALDTGRRRQEDEAWLLNIFKYLLNTQQNSIYYECTYAMLQLSIDYKVNLELELLRSITLNSILSECNQDWKLIGILIKLNPNIFMISKENVLLEKLLEKITMASLDYSWASISDEVVSQILVPLIVKFAKEKNLIRFLHFWYKELSRFEGGLNKSQNFSQTRFSAWEDDRLHLELRKLLVSSVDSFQIREIITWISKKFDEEPYASCVLLEVITGSISGQEDLVETISLEPYHIMYNELKFFKLNSRYRWRAWRTLTHTLNWANTSDLCHLGRLWRDNNPFNSPLNSVHSLFAVNQENQAMLPESLEIFRSICAAFSASTKGSLLEYSIRPVAISYLRLLFSDVAKFHADFKSKNSDKFCISRLVFDFIRCVFVEYPKILTLGLDLKSDFGPTLQAIFDLVSGSFASLSCTSDRFEISANACSDLWYDAFESDEVLTNKELIEIMVDVILSKFILMEYEDESAKRNCSFATMLLNKIPLEVIKKKQREQIMRSWLLIHSKEVSSFEKCQFSQMSLDPAFLALKIRIMARNPNLYEGLEFGMVTAIADKIFKTDISQINIKLPLLKELTRLVIAHAHTNVDQIRRRTYLNDVLESIQNQSKNLYRTKKKLNAAFIAIAGAALFEFQKKTANFQETPFISKEEVGEKINDFRQKILIELKTLLQKFSKKYHRKKKISSYKIICIHVIIDALTDLGVSESQVAELGSEAQAIIKSSSKIGDCLNTFLIVYGPKNSNGEIPLGADGNISSIERRKLVQQITEVIINANDDARRLEILHSLLKEYHDDRTRIDKLMAARYIIISIKDKNSSNIIASGECCSNELNDPIDDTARDDFDLNFAYNLLNSELRETQDILSFCIISETLDLMLRTKIYAISQYVIDSTLGTISILCSPKSPQLPATRSGTIFLHLTQLIQSIITHHRLKLKGHFPLVQLSLQGLLRCFFLPISNYTAHSSETIASGFETVPVWLTNPQFQLNSRNAESYTRLLTLINDPSVSSVQERRSGLFVSATKKWKRMSMFFMRFVLYDYINWQLKFRISPEVKEKLLPGFYSFLENTTPEMRKLISAELNSSGRALYVNLFTDYTKFKNRGGL